MDMVQYELSLRSTSLALTSSSENKQLRRQLANLGHAVPPSSFAYDRSKCKEDKDHTAPVKHEDPIDEAPKDHFNPFARFAATDLHEVLPTAHRREKQEQLNHHHYQTASRNIFLEPEAGRSAFDIPSPFEPDIPFNIRGGFQSSTRGEQLRTSHKDRAQHDRPLDVSDPVTRNDIKLNSSSPFKRNRSPHKSSDIFNPYRSPTSTISPKKQRREGPGGSSSHYFSNQHSAPRLPTLSERSTLSPRKKSSHHHHEFHHSTPAPYRTAEGLFARCPPTARSGVIPTHGVISEHRLGPGISVSSLKREGERDAHTRRRGVPEAGVRVFSGAKTSRAV